MDFTRLFQGHGTSMNGMVANLRDCRDFCLPKSLAIVDSKFVRSKPEPGPIVFALMDINALAPERISRRSVQPCGE
jgi:hypothetical protein